MRIADTDFILVPDWVVRPISVQPEDDHWISRWHRNLATARWIGREERPDDEGCAVFADAGAAAAALIRQIEGRTRPVIVVTHGRGVDVLLAAVSTAEFEWNAAGAFVVAPTVPQLDYSGPVSLGEGAVVIASDDHPEVPQSVARDIAAKLGGSFVSAGSSGRIDAQSGQGPWPEGLMQLGAFLKRLTRH